MVEAVEGKDATDHLSHGHTLTEFRQVPTPQPSTTAPAGRLALKSLSTVKRRRYEMLTPDLMIPVGTVTVLAGQQGVGKGTTLALLAAILTRAGYGVIFLSDEDSAEAVIKPRIQAAGGDVSRAYVVEAVRDDAGVLLPRDADELGRLAASHNVRLIVIDPWTNHVEGMDIDKGSMRLALMPLRRIAEQYNLVVALSAHPVKNAGQGDPLSEIAHASAVTQIARSAYWLTPDPEWTPPQSAADADEQRNPYVLASHIKNNLTKKGATLRFRFDEVVLEAADGEPRCESSERLKLAHRGSLTRGSDGSSAVNPGPQTPARNSRSARSGL